MKKNIKKILIVRLGAIGDVIHSTIIAQSIKSKHPECEIDFITSKSICPLIKSNKYLSNVLSFDSQKKNNFLYLIKLGLDLRRRKYDVVINLTNSLRNYLISAIISPKINLKRNKNRIHAVDAFFNTALDLFNDLEKPNKINLSLSDEVIDNVKNKLNNYKRPFFVLNPGGDNDKERQGRIWDNKNWKELANTIIQKYGGTVFVVGSKSERESHLEITNDNGVEILSGTLSLEESAAVYSFADIFISGDSGPLHIASTFDVNIVALMGSTSPDVCGPYSPKGICIVPTIDCKYCGQKICSKIEENSKITPCMKSITTDSVMNAIINIMEKQQ